MPIIDISLEKVNRTIDIIARRKHGEHEEILTLRILENKLMTII